MTLYVGSPIFGGHLQPSAVDGDSPAMATVIDALAGNTRALIESAYGNAAPGNMPCISRNQNGQLGEDHTGGGYGAQINHSFYTYCGQHSDAATTTRNISWTDPATTDPVKQFAHKFASPYCADGGNYKTAKIKIHLRISTAPASSKNVVVKVYTNPSLDPVLTTTIATGTSSGVWVANGNTDYVPLAGGWQHMWTRFEPQAGSYIFGLASISLSVV
jgi:hypothetical protein